ncbi:MAG TPA: XrtA/PEP-CTERM system TPR-repeat protein PrsT, partial [Burkholderiales bacterium]|nr:XrtA/PEP-CTERM system TPR-repeat protein PrsT [Burkholderiales bacterium]
MVLKASPQHIPSLILASTIELESGNYSQAEDHLNKILQINPRFSAVRRTLVSTYLRSGDPERAKEELHKLTGENPNDPALAALRGEVALAGGQIEEAAQNFQKAVSGNPKDIGSRIRLGQVKFASGNTQEGIENLEKALNDDPSQYQADISLISIYLSKKEFSKALTAAESLIRKQPQSPQAYNLRALVHLSSGEETKARADLEQALKLQPTFFPAVRNLANLDINNGDFEGARHRYDGVLSRDPKNIQALLALAGLLASSSASGSTDATKLIDRAIESSPKSAAARIAKVRYLTAQGDKKGALAAAQQAAVVLPESPAVLEALGRIQLTNGDTNQAISTFGKLASLLPKSVLPLAGQADAYAAAKDWENARRTLTKALELDKNSLGVKKAMVQISLLANEPERALTEIHDIQKQWPDNPEGYVVEARLLLSQRKAADAEQVLRSALAKHPSVGLSVAMINFLNTAGKGDEAESLAAQWLKQNPKDAAVAAAQGEAKMAARDYAGAQRWWRIALKAQPDSPLLLNNLAWTLGQLKDPSAIEIAEKALKLAPNSAAVIDTLGWIRVETGAVDKGIELLGRAHRLEPNNAGIRLNLAKALIKAGRKAEAKPYLDPLTRLPPESPTRKEAESLLAQS